MALSAAGENLARKCLNFKTWRDFHVSRCMKELVPYVYEEGVKYDVRPGYKVYRR